jgi:hypothetical protein
LLESALPGTGKERFGDTRLAPSFSVEPNTKAACAADARTGLPIVRHKFRILLALRKAAAPLAINS